MSTVAQRFSANMKAAREELGWSQVKLADAAGVDRRIVGRIEQIGAGVTLERSAELALALDADLALLLDTEPGVRRHFGKARRDVSSAGTIANVVRLRLAAEFSQRALATRAGIHPNRLSVVEKGEQNLHLATLEKLATALGVSVGALL